VNNGEITAYEYDTDGRLYTVTVGTRIFTYTYTGGNQVPDQLQRPNGSITYYTYDYLYRLKDINNKNSSGVILTRNEFIYDKAHMRTKETITNAEAPGYLPNKTFAFNNVNQLTTTGYTYDDDGNMTSFITPEGYAATAMYDAENRLKTAAYTDGNNITHDYSFFYNADGILAKQVIDGVETRFVRAGYLILEERNASNNVTRSYVWDGVSPGGIGGLLELTQGGQHYDYLFDGKGNVNALIDASQNVVAAYRHDAFGNLISKSGTLDQPYQFSTKMYYAALGVVKYERRDYLPILGKWMEKDPMGEAGGQNLYGAMGNNVINRIDSLGLFSWFRHYFMDNGEAVDLNQIGLLNNYINSPDVIKWTGSYNKKCAFEAHFRAKGACSGCGKGLKRVDFDVTEEFYETDSRLIPGLYQLGHSKLHLKGSCHVWANCSNKTYQYECYTHSWIRDSFNDPWDVFNLVKKDYNPGGTPYSINADFWGKLSGNGGWK